MAIAKESIHAVHASNVQFVRKPFKKGFIPVSFVVYSLLDFM
ncbi:hypothetical protein [Pseudotamlana agarivorans]|nr:hypothetical protein [Tamlana agarivorans]